MKHDHRLTLAWLTAPLVALLAVAVAICGVGFIERPPSSALAALTESGEIAVVLLLYGTPFAYCVELLVGIPTFHLLTASNRLTRSAVIATATLTGLLSFPALTALLFTEWDWTVALIGGLAGAAAGGFFWSVGLSSTRRGVVAER